MKKNKLFNTKTEESTKKDLHLSVYVYNPTTFCTEITKIHV